MDFRIGRIFELLRHHRTGRRIDDLLRLGDGAFHAERSRRQLELRTEQRQHLAALDRHRLRHDQDQLVAARRGDERERDAGVAGSRLDKCRLAGRNLARGFHGIDHADADAVLDAGNRIEEFELRQKIGADIVFFGDAVEPHDRRIADRVGDGIIDAAAPRCVDRRRLLLQGWLSHKLLPLGMMVAGKTRSDRAACR